MGVPFIGEQTSLALPCLEAVLPLILLVLLVLSVKRQCTYTYSRGVECVLFFWGVDPPAHLCYLVTSIPLAFFGFCWLYHTSKTQSASIGGRWTQTTLPTPSLQVSPRKVWVWPSGTDPGSTSGCHSRGGCSVHTPGRGLDAAHWLDAASSVKLYQSRAHMVRCPRISPSASQRALEDIDRLIL